MALNVIQELEREQIDASSAKRGVPEFGPGDTVKVMVKVIEGGEGDAKDKKKAGHAKAERQGAGFRLQAYEGVVIARSGGGINESFTVRKISYGEGVERVFPVYSPYIAEIEVRAPRQGASRQALLSARPPRQVGAHLRAHGRARQAPQRRLQGLQEAEGRGGRSDADQGRRRRSRRSAEQLGVIKFEQIANFSDDDIANVDETLRLNGRIEKEDWVGQAQKLLAEAAAAEVPAEDDKKA